MRDKRICGGFPTRFYAIEYEQSNFKFLNKKISRKLFLIVLIYS